MHDCQQKRHSTRTEHYILRHWNQVGRENLFVWDVLQQMTGNIDKVILICAGIVKDAF